MVFSLIRLKSAEHRTPTRVALWLYLARRNVHTFFDPPSLCSLHVQILVVPTVVAQVGQSAHALRRGSQPKAGRSERPRVGARNVTARADVPFVVAVQIIVVAVIVTGELTNLDEVLGCEVRGDLGIRNDVPRFEAPSLRRPHIDIVVITAALAVDDSSPGALWRRFEHGSRKVRGGCRARRLRGRCGCTFLRVASVVADHHFDERLSFPHFATAAAAEVTAGRGKEIRVLLATAAEQRAPVGRPHLLNFCAVLISWGAFDLMPCG